MQDQLPNQGRSGKLVKRAAGITLPRSMHIHPKWFRVRAERIGPRVRLRVDGFQTHADVSFDDPDPLTGRRVAIWTYDNGLVLGRVRISGHADPTLASPDRTPKLHPSTFYNLD